jgi:hypothetical protein
MFREFCIKTSQDVRTIKSSNLNNIRKFLINNLGYSLTVNFQLAV